MRKRRYNRAVIIFACAVATIIVVLGLRALMVGWQVKPYREYWQKRANEPIPDKAFIYVALGDSAAQSIGASTPESGYVGLIAERVAKKTGRPVHVINLSITGAKLKGALDEQIPQLEKLSVKPDLITIDIGSNDLRMFDESQFKTDLQALAQKLPKGTVIAEISPYYKEKEIITNRLIHQEATKHELVVAPLSDLLLKNRSWRNYAGDFFHPSSDGYKIWAQAFLEVIEPRLN